MLRTKTIAVAAFAISIFGPGLRFHAAHGALAANPCGGMLSAATQMVKFYRIFDRNDISTEEIQKYMLSHYTRPSRIEKTADELNLIYESQGQSQVFTAKINRQRTANLLNMSCHIESQFNQ